MSQDDENIAAMKKIKDALDALQGIKYVEGIGFVPIDEVKQEITKETKQPNALWHLRISLVKSIFRILAGASLFIGEFEVAGILIITAELLGIAEELV